MKNNPFEALVIDHNNGGALEVRVLLRRTSPESPDGTMNLTYLTGGMTCQCVQHTLGEASETFPLLQFWNDLESRAALGALREAIDNYLGPKKAPEDAAGLKALVEAKSLHVDHLFTIIQGMQLKGGLA